MVKKKRNSRISFYLENLRILVPLTMIGKEGIFKEIMIISIFKMIKVSMRYQVDKHMNKLVWN